jgi:hypothetical protein
MGLPKSMGGHSNLQSRTRSIEAHGGINNETLIHLLCGVGTDTRESLIRRDDH